jgi:hypothetical protein
MLGSTFIDYTVSFNHCGLTRWTECLTVMLEWLNDLWDGYPECAEKSEHGEC